MTRDEAKQVLGRMTAAWPRQELSAPTAEVWIEHLLTKRVELTADIVKQLEGSSDWFPSIREFQVEYDAALHYENLAASDDRGLPRPVERKAPPEAAAKYLAEMREAIKRGKEKQKQRVRERAAEMGRILDEHDKRSK